MQANLIKEGIMVQFQQQIITWDLCPSSLDFELTDSDLVNSYSLTPNFYLSDLRNFRIWASQSRQATIGINGNNTPTATIKLPNEFKDPDNISCFNINVPYNCKKIPHFADPIT